MKYLFPLLLICLSLSACKKKYVDPAGFEYCRFSLAINGVIPQHSYYLREGRLYDHSPGYNGSLPLPEDQCLKASKVMKEIPSVLVRDPTTTYTCFCGSFDKIILEYKENERVYTWTIDLDSKNIPRRVNKFARKVYDLISELEK